MLKQRNIPFGYILSGGKILVHPEESVIVKSIFESYINNGISYQKIAEMLTQKNILYRENNTVWNRSVIKRILDNSRYCGTDHYPTIIQKPIFDQVFEIKSARNRYHNTLPILTAIRRKTLCLECGAKYGRQTKSSRDGTWYCENGCKSRTRDFDTVLPQKILAILNKVIAAPDLLDNADSFRYQPNLEIMKLTNEINRELEKRELDKEHLKVLIMNCAAEKYNACQQSVISFHTLELKALFKGRSPMIDLDESLFSKSVQSVLIGTDGSVHLQFVNQKIISQNMK